MPKVNLTMVNLTRSPVFFAGFMLLALAACTPPSATKQYPPEIIIPKKRVEAPVELPPKVYDETKMDEGTAQSGTAQQAPKPPTSTPPSDSPAVLALMQEANDNSASGQLDNAAATLERAIRIQPRNALLWQKLAEVRLKQNQPGLAEDLAKKSNVLAKDNKSLVGKNWSIIADARRQKGDAEGASDADSKAKR
jgi:predicted Zn-dependent protease